jgi:eukaryotic-like serine/threonine-protein kinase
VISPLTRGADHQTERRTLSDVQRTRTDCAVRVAGLGKRVVRVPAGVGLARDSSTADVLVEGPRPVAPPGRSGERVAGRYRLDSVLGAGGMGTVWRAYDEVLQRHVAVKALLGADEANLAHILREARAAARVVHDAVVLVHDVVLNDSDGGWIVMEALPGKALSVAIRERGRIPISEARQIGRQVLDALEAIHDAGLVHGDVKPSNVQLCDARRVVLTDFGLAAPPNASAKLPGETVVGSLGYIAPETIGKGIYGAPSDLYALGVTLYAALEGHRPFRMSRPSAVLNAMTHADYPAPTHAGPLRRLIDGLLQAEPSKRPDVTHARTYLRREAWSRSS